MNFILFDQNWEDLLPLSYTRPVSEMRVGILTIKEKWEAYLQVNTSYLTQEYLTEKYPLKTAENNVFVNASFLPDQDIADLVLGLKPNQAIMYGENILAISVNESNSSSFSGKLAENTELIPIEKEVSKINHPWDIFSLNGKELEKDYQLLTKGRTSQKISKSNSILGNQIFVEEGAKIECAILNSTSGPIYIGKDAEIMEGSIIRGPFAICEHSATKLGTKIYGPTTIGPHSKVGGELNNVVIFGFSNKAHDGFLGNSVIGEWCNIGADSNNSNLKNNYAEVKMWNYVKNKFIPTGLQFCGLIMGDHSKCGINTMFNTGTVVGVSANIFGDGFPRNFIPSFSWGGASGFTEFKPDKAFEVAEKVFARRELTFNDIEKNILMHIHKDSEKHRAF